MFGPKKKQGGKKGGKKEAGGEVPTIPVQLPSTKPLVTPGAENKPAPLPQLMVGCAQSVGMHRDHNEDAILTLTSLSANNDGYLPIGLFIIADGMGGHNPFRPTTTVIYRSGYLSSRMAWVDTNTARSPAIWLSIPSPTASWAK
jgi:hypothetical protein